MSLYGKIAAQTEIKYCDGDVFHQIFRYRPNDLSIIIPHIIQGCSLYQGEWGAEGSIIIWNFVHEGKEAVHKDLVEAIDEEKKSVTLKVLEGYILELYKSFRATVEVDTKGEKKMVTWSFEYEKLNKDIPDPNSFLDTHIIVTKDIDTYYRSPPAN